MIQRLLTALLLILGLLAVLLLLPGAAALPVFALFLLGGAWEWSGFVAGAARGQRLAYVTVIGMLMGATYYLAAAAGFKLNTLFLVSVVFWVLALVPLARFPITVPDMAVRIAGILVLLPAWLALARLVSASAAGPYWLLFFFVLVWSADIGAFFTGRAFGKRRLAPRVSPNKTWAGLFGGLGAAAVSAVGAAVVLDVDLMILVPFGIVVAGMSVVGDLVVSMFKRNAGLKDSGRLFPGHGGILDRVDSLAGGAPLFALGLDWFGLIL